MHVGGGWTTESSRSRGVPRGPTDRARGVTPWVGTWATGIHKPGIPPADPRATWAKQVGGRLDHRIQPFQGRAPGTHGPSQGGDPLGRHVGDRDPQTWDTTGRPQGNLGEARGREAGRSYCRAGVAYAAPATEPSLCRRERGLPRSLSTGKARSSGRTAVPCRLGSQPGWTGYLTLGEGCNPFLGTGSR